jgi:hypothetical protein
MTDAEFATNHPNRAPHFSEHDRLTTLQFKLRHNSPKWKEICSKYETKFSSSNTRTMKNFHEYINEHFTNNAEDHQLLNSSTKSQGQNHSLEEYASGNDKAHFASQEKSGLKEPCKLCTYWHKECQDRNLLSDTSQIPGNYVPQPGYHSTEECKFLKVNNTYGNIRDHCHPLPLEDIKKPIDFQHHNQKWKQATKEEIDKKIDNYLSNQGSKIHKRPRQGSTSTSQTSENTRPHKQSNYPPDHNLDKHGNRSNQGGSGGGDRNSRGGSGGRGPSGGRGFDKQSYKSAVNNSGNRTNYQNNPQGYNQPNDNRDQNRRDQRGGNYHQNNPHRDDSRNQAYNANDNQSSNRGQNPFETASTYQQRNDYPNNQCPDRNSEDDYS